MPVTRIQLVIELESAVAPIAGTVREQPDGDAQRFRGWLELTETLEAIRRTGLGCESNEDERLHE
jgi:hypothetical protein